MTERKKSDLRLSQIALAGLVVMFSGAAVLADTKTIGASKDAMIFGTNGNADTNNASGKGPGMFAGADAGTTPNRKRSLIQFDITGNIPAGSQITGATMTLFLGQIAGSGGGGTGSTIPSRTFNLFDNLQDWGEGNSGSPTSTTIGGTGQGFARVTGDSSWDYAMYDSTNTAAGKWNAGASDLHGGNFASTASASSTFTSPFTTGNSYSWSSAGMVADLQAWLDSPSTNHGWLLKAMNGLDTLGNVIDLETTSQSFLGFWTKDGAAANNNSAIAPKLQITYTVPEPASLALFLSAIPLFVRRTRKI